MKPISIKCISLIILLFFASVALCQQQKIDSLKKALLTLKEDTNRVSTLIKLAKKIASSGDLDNALPYLQESHRLSTKLNYHFGISASLNYIGNIYLNQSAYPEALESFIQSLEEAERNNIRSGMAAALGNIGIVYYEQGEFDKALRYHFKSLKIDESLGNLKGVASSYNSIGNIYFQKKNYPKVIECYNKSLEIKNKIGDIEGSASTLANIGNTYYFQNNFKKTQEYYFKALTLFEEVNDLQSVAMLLNNLAETYVGEKNFKEALKHSEKSLQMSVKIGSLDDIKSAYKTLSTAYEGLGNHQLALKNHKQYVRYKDSVYNEHNTRKTIESEVKYHFDKKTLNTRIENERKQIILKEEAKKQRLIIYFGSGILALVIIFAIFAFRSFKIKQRINLQLSQQKEEIIAQRDEIELQRTIVEEKNKDLTDSINYAKRIQYTLLAHDAFLKENLAQHFIYFHPKDIVSGDFYWATKKGNKFFLAVCDCTGHGVPGAFMSLLSISFLNEAITERGILSPDKILNYVRERLIDSVSKDGQRDGFDGILICMEEDSSQITYASAHNNPIAIGNNELIELPYDKMPVGFNDNAESFSLHSIEVKKGTMLYLFTDGYADQFGGTKGKKFKYKKLTELLMDINSKELNKQKEILKDSFTEWKGNLEQVDDVCIIGIRF